MWEAIGAFCGILAGLIALVKFILAEYFKKSKELEETKKFWTEKAINELSDTVAEHQKYMLSLRRAVEDNTKQQSATKNQLIKAHEVWVKYLKAHNERSKKLESKVVTLSNDLMLVTKSGQKKTQD